MKRRYTIWYLVIAVAAGAAMSVGGIAAYGKYAESTNGVSNGNLTITLSLYDGDVLREEWTVGYSRPSAIQALTGYGIKPLTVHAPVGSWNGEPILSADARAKVTGSNLATPIKGKLSVTGDVVDGPMLSNTLSKDWELPSNGGEARERWEPVATGRKALCPKDGDNTHTLTFKAEGEATDTAGKKTTAQAIANAVGTVKCGGTGQISIGFTFLPLSTTEFTGEGVRTATMVPHLVR